MEDKQFRISRTFTADEIATIASALNYYAYNAPHINEEIYDWAMSALDKVMEAAEYGEI